MISHKNIVQYYQSFEQEDKIYILMEYLEGMDLRSMLDKQRFSETEVVSILIQISSALT